MAASEQKPGVPAHAGAAPAIRIEGLRKTFGALCALDGLDLSVETGSIFGFLGPNGAGKTTTMRILTGLARPTAGRAWLNGVEVTRDRRQAAPQIGFLPEDPAFYPWMTGAEFLDHVGRVFGLRAQERRTRAAELLELVDLTKAARRRVGGYSGGMKQRLGIAQALVNRPPILLLDEPVSSLDPIGRREVLLLIEQLRGQCTVFMSTHILSDVERVCDTVGIIHHGRLIARAQQQELLEQYAVPAFEIEAEHGLDEQLKAWAEHLVSADWAASATASGRVVRILVNDLETAKQRLVVDAIEAGLVLTRYEVVRPSLEDVFMRLVGEGGE